MTQLVFLSTLGTALGCGLMAGTFFAFSTFVMRALARLRPAQAIEAMQSINRTVLNPWFLGVFFGTAVAGLAGAAYALATPDQMVSPFQIAGGLLYVVGTFGVTVVFNVPMNNALDKVDPTGDGTAEAWARYLARWTMWNHVRTIAALLGAAALGTALHAT